MKKYVLVIAVFLSIETYTIESAQGFMGNRLMITDYVNMFHTLDNIAETIEDYCIIAKFNPLALKNKKLKHYIEQAQKQFLDAYNPFSNPNAYLSDFDLHLHDQSTKDISSIYKAASENLMQQFKTELAQLIAQFNKQQAITLLHCSFEARDALIRFLHYSSLYSIYSPRPGSIEAQYYKTGIAYKFADTIKQHSNPKYLDPIIQQHLLELKKQDPSFFKSGYVERYSLDTATSLIGLESSCYDLIHDYSDDNDFFFLKKFAFSRRQWLKWNLKAIISGHDPIELKYVGFDRSVYPIAKIPVPGVLAQAKMLAFALTEDTTAKSLLDEIVDDLAIIDPAPLSEEQEKNMMNFFDDAFATLIQFRDLIKERFIHGNNQPIAIDKLKELEAQSNRNKGDKIHYSAVNGHIERVAQKMIVDIAEPYDPTKAFFNGDYQYDEVIGELCQILGKKIEPTYLCGFRILEKQGIINQTGILKIDKNKSFFETIKENWQSFMQWLHGY